MDIFQKVLEYCDIVNFHNRTEAWWRMGSPSCRHSYPTCGRPSFPAPILDLMNMKFKNRQFGVREYSTHTYVKHKAERKMIVNNFITWLFNFKTEKIEMQWGGAIFAIICWKVGRCSSNLKCEYFLLMVPIWCE